MCNLELISLVRLYQRQNRENFVDIYQIFENLVLHYSRRLHSEDGVAELTLFLIELLDAIEPDKFKPDDSCGLKGYIAVSIRNQYITLSKRIQRYEFFYADLSEYTVSYWPDYENNLILTTALAALTQKQRQVLLYKYIYGYSDIEIAGHLQISRQAVNRLKSRGLLSLRDALGVHE